MQRKPPWDAMNMEQIGIYENMTVSKFGEDIEQWAFSYLVVGIYFGAVTLETNAVLPNLIKYMCILEPSNSIVSYLASWL